MPGCAKQQYKNLIELRLWRTTLEFFILIYSASKRKIQFGNVIRNG